MLHIRIAPILPLTLAMALAANTGAAAEPAPGPATDLHTALVAGKAHLEFRYRLESVDQEPFGSDATASTLRSRLNYQTGELRGFSAFFEADNVTVIGDEDAYNSTVNGAVSRPVIADPEFTEVNQAYLQYKAGSFTGLLGRQRITLDNQRFVGNVGWRQNEQTFDAVTLKGKLLSKVQLQYSFIGNVNRITGPEEGAQAANFHGAVQLLNGKADLGPYGALAGFAYLLDLENAPALSSSTVGLHWSGAHKLSGTAALNWTVSYASQRDYADNPNSYRADYVLVEGGATLGRYGVRAGYEVLGGDSQPNRAFQTPLATLHAFNGWADKFLTTPAGGIEDLYVGASANLGPVALQLAWHDFQAEAIDADYGSEWNASAALKFGAKKNYEALLKFADYRADGFATDTTKLWLQVSAAF